MRYAVVAIGLAALAAGCATMPVAGVATPSSNATAIPSTPLDLGDWRHASAAETLSHFQDVVNSRYGAGVAAAAVSADLRRNDFTCGANNDPHSRGDPPAFICRKTVSANNCTNTWQVHLFDTHGDGRVARTRAIYDRRCNGDGLLGGNN
jgi:hypothetical protein